MDDWDHTENGLLHFVQLARGDHQHKESCFWHQKLLLIKKPTFPYHTSFPHTWMQGVWLLWHQIAIISSSKQDHYERFFWWPPDQYSPEVPYSDIKHSLAERAEGWYQSPLIYRQEHKHRKNRLRTISRVHLYGCYGIRNGQLLSSRYISFIPTDREAIFEVWIFEWVRRLFLSLRSPGLGVSDYPGFENLQGIIFFFLS